MDKGKVLIIRHEDMILTVLTAENRLRNVSVCGTQNKSLVGNIYIGKVKNIVTNIQAAFVEIDKGLLCYLSLSEGKNPILLSQRKWDGKLKEGDELLVQVQRDVLKTKQPAVTAQISISGSYMVINARESGKVGISGKLPRTQKEALRALIEERGLNTSYDMVLRTNAGQLTGQPELLEKEWNLLNKEMEQLLHNAPFRTCYSCLRKGNFEYLNALKEIYFDEYDEIVTDDPEIYQNVRTFLAEQGNPAALRFYEDSLLPLSKLYGVESKIKEALGSRVWLKSGGYLVIEPTEAMTVIDVNTGKYDAKKADAEETYLKINLEAAKEIACQLRLRNLSGIIVVDFINMKAQEHQTKLLQELRNHVKKDTVKTDVIDITPLGLVELTRKKINKPLKEQLAGYMDNFKVSK